MTNARAKTFKLLALVFVIQLVITSGLWAAVGVAFPQEKPMPLYLQYGFFALLYSVPFLAYMYALYGILPRSISSIGRVIILCVISLMFAWLGMFVGTTIWFITGF